MQKNSTIQVRTHLQKLNFILTLLLVPLDVTPDTPCGIRTYYIRD
jgi:hypothetical protein